MPIVQAEKRKAEDSVDYKNIIFEGEKICLKKRAE
jgi:hypothetical protein